MPAGRSIVQYFRVYYRVSVNYPVILCSNAVMRIGLMTTLSVNGCTIECQKPLDPSHHIEAHLRFSNQSEPLVIEAAIR